MIENEQLNDRKYRCESFFVVVKFEKGTPQVLTILYYRLAHLDQGIVVKAQRCPF